MHWRGIVLKEQNIIYKCKFFSQCFPTLAIYASLFAILSVSSFLLNAGSFAERKQNLISFPYHISPSWYRHASSTLFFLSDSLLHRSTPELNNFGFKMNVMREKLEILTIKELRRYLKNITVNVDTSHLRLKLDIIEMLIEHLQYFSAQRHVNNHFSKSNPFLMKVPEYLSEYNTKSKSSIIQKIPSIYFDNFNHSRGYNRIKTKKSDGTTKGKYPDIYPRFLPKMYQFLYHVPSLLHAHVRWSYTRALNILGEFDIRQINHPLLRGLTGSDMDIITIGTASCVPGLTRGVSCTALRLQWRRGRGKKFSKNRSIDCNFNEMSSIFGQRREYLPSLKCNTDIERSFLTSGTWIFDCGESTQLQIQRTGSVRPGKITKVFITHAHGDHSFGLPGLMCLMGQDRARDSPPIDIYGPEGLRMWLRVNLRYSVSRIVPRYRVHELMDIPMAPEWIQGRWKEQSYDEQLYNRIRSWRVQGFTGKDKGSWISCSPTLNLKANSLFGEIDGGRNIYPLYNHPKCVNGAPIWEVEDEGDIRVYAAPMCHNVPCVGYVAGEVDKPGRLRSDLIKPIVMRNFKFLKKSGIQAPMKVMDIIKNLPERGLFMFPDGTVVHKMDVVEPFRKGRKIVICGDTSDSRAIVGLAQGADVLIHEATNTFINGIDKDTNNEVVTLNAKIHGHSTPYMAGEFAKRIRAKTLIMNHFSPRYKGDQSLESMLVMSHIELQAMKTSELPADKVVAAWDFMSFPIPHN